MTAKHRSACKKKHISCQPSKPFQLPHQSSGREFSIMKKMALRCNSNAQKCRGKSVKQTPLLCSQRSPPKSCSKGAKSLVANPPDSLRGFLSREQSACRIGHLQGASPKRAGSSAAAPVLQVLFSFLQELPVNRVQWFYLRIYNNLRCGHSDGNDTNLFEGARHAA